MQTGGKFLIFFYVFPVLFRLTPQTLELPAFRGGMCFDVSWVSPVQLSPPASACRDRRDHGSREGQVKYREITFPNHG